MGAEVGVDPDKYRRLYALVVGVIMVVFYGLMMVIGDATSSSYGYIGLFLTMPASCVAMLFPYAQIYLAAAVFWFLLAGSLAYFTRKPWKVLAWLLGLWIGLAGLGYLCLMSFLIRTGGP